MNLKKLFVNSTIIGGVLFILTISIFFTNSVVYKCQDDFHTKNDETSTCTYSADTCQVGEISEVVDGTNTCTYEGTHFLSGNLIKGFIITIFAIWIIVGGVYAASRVSRRPADTSAFKKDDFVQVRRAKEIISEVLSESMYIPTINNVAQASAFVFEDSEPFPFRKEWFWKCQVEITTGSRPGIYTWVVSLSRGEEWIRGEMFRIRRTLYDDFKISRDMPLDVPESSQERMLERLEETHPERAAQLREQMAEKAIMSPQADQVEFREDKSRVVHPQRYYRRPVPYRRYV